MAANVLTVAQGVYHPALFSPGLRASQLHWISGAPPAATSCECTARIRHQQPVQACTLDHNGKQCEVHFKNPQRAIAPGQSVVFYQGEECLGGAIIEEAVTQT